MIYDIKNVEIFIADYEKRLFAHYLLFLNGIYFIALFFETVKNQCNVKVLNFQVTCCEVHISYPAY